MFDKTVRFYDEELLAHSPTPNMEHTHVSVVRVYLFNIFEPTLNIGDHSSIPNLRTLHAVVTGTHLLWHRWEDNIKRDLQDVECGSMNWIELARYGDSWCALVNKVMILRLS